MSIEAELSRHLAGQERAERAYTRCALRLEDGCPECGAALDADWENRQGVVACRAVVAGEPCEGLVRMDEVVAAAARRVRLLDCVC